MEYTKLFNPDPIQAFDLPETTTTDQGDIGNRSVYVYNKDIVLAVNVALATGRPLLIRGSSGGGKSSLALNVTHVLKRRFYPKVISSRTQARDLLWEVDHLRRLQDAHTQTLKPDFTPYITPGVFWKAFDPQSAQQQQKRCLTSPTNQQAMSEETKPNGTVVLLDEIDKADPDVPNNLLVPLGSLSFMVEETGETVQAQSPPLVIITTNEERQLPVAFLRRCVELRLKNPDTNDLIRIGQAHFPSTDDALLHQVAERILNPANSDTTPSIAEYLDTVKACLQLNIDPNNPLWEDLSQITVWKHGRQAGRNP